MVLIDMDMPKNCKSCELIKFVGYSACECKLTGSYIDVSSINKRAEGCPLKAVLDFSMKKDDK